MKRVTKGPREPGSKPWWRGWTMDMSDAAFAVTNVKAKKELEEVVDM